MEIVRVREKQTRCAPRPETVGRPPLIERRGFWLFVRLAVFIAVFLAVFLLFPREAS
jgi:hypothetical protein